MNRLLIAAVFVSSISYSAQASPVLELFGGDSPDRPWSGRSADHGPMTAYFNPARLSKKIQVARFTYLITLPRLNIGFEPRPVGYDVPESVYAGRHLKNGALEPLERRPFATEDLPYKRPSTQSMYGDEHFLIFGLTTPLIDDRLALGLVMTLKAGLLQTQRPFFPDERHQYFGEGLNFEFMGDRLESMMATVGLSFQVMPRLSVGLGGTLLNHASSVPQIYIPDASNQEDAQTTPIIEVEPTIAPHFGVHWAVSDQIDVSGALHMASDSRLTGNGRLRFWEFEYPEGQNQLNQPFDLVFLYQPLRTSVGARYGGKMAADTLFEVYGDLVWSQWSRYIARHGERVDGWKDTLAGSLGLTFDLGRHRLGWGMNYQPTPIPEQDGRTNYTDNEKMGTQLGWSWEVLGDGYSLELGVGVHIQRWLDRTHVKSSTSDNPVLDEFPNAVDARTLQPIPESRGLQTNNPGFPGFSHGGWLHGILFSVALVK